MSNYAIVENGVIVDVQYDLPLNWKNVSNFHLLKDDEEYLKTFGWYKIKKIIPEYNSSTHSLGNSFRYFDNDNVYESYQVVDLPSPPQIFHSNGVPFTYTEEELEQQRLGAIASRWVVVRTERDQLMKDFEWRYQRYERQIRLNIATTDLLSDLDNFMQALADITNQEDPFNIIWPTYTDSSN